MYRMELRKPSSIPGKKFVQPSCRGVCVHFASALAAIILMACFSLQLFAQQDQDPAANLTAITATGSARFSSDQIAAMSGLGITETVHRADFQRAADRLAALGCFSNVRYTFTSKGNAVQVAFEVADAPSVSADFDNFPWLDDQEIQQALKKSISLYDGTLPLQGTLLDGVSQVLQKLLAEHHIRGSLQFQLIAAPDSDDQMMRIRLDSPAMKIGSIEFGDSLAQNDVHIRERLSDIVGKPYSRYDIEVFNLERVRPLYWQNAHLHVRFGTPQVRFSGDPNRPLPESLTIFDPIDPGPSFTWGGATWTGNSVLAVAELNGMVELQPGQPADGMKIAAGWESVRAAYGRRGFLDVRVDPAEDFDMTQNRASYRVRITEGPQYRMGELVLTGVSLAAERRIRAAWKMDKGSIFDRAYFDAFVATGIKQALNGLPVHIEKIGQFLRTDPRTATVDVLLDFQ